MDDPGRTGDAFSVLRRFARRPASSAQCELCSRAVADEHPHVLETAQRRLLCVCDTCAILFPGGHAKYRRVPNTIRGMADFRLTDAQWDRLLIPIEMAFFYQSSPVGRVVASYPSPAGATESLLPLATWEEIVTDNPVLATLLPDVEALIVNRLGSGTREPIFQDHRPEYYILPIDQCFRLVGLIRLHWKGLSGGSDVWREIAGFFDEIRSKAEPSREVVRA
jgi:hypothetical protein